MIELSVAAQPQPVPIPRRRAVAVAGLILLLTTLLALFTYKWSGSVRTIESVRAAGWTKSPDAITTGGVLKTTINYFGRVWIALVFGILIGAAVRALLSPKWIVALLGQGGTVRRQLSGGLSGAPLMLCSCCVTPIFTSVYERGARLGSALSMMLASPGLNLAALVLTFMLFPLNLSLARLGAALAAVFLLPVLLERLFGGTLKPVLPPGGVEEGPRSFRDFGIRYFKSVGYLTAVTLPLITAGVLLSGLLLPYGISGTGGRAVLAVLGVAAISVVVALPTFFEIPLAILLLQMGSPGAAAALLFAGPIANLPSLFVLARETSWKVSVGLATGIWLLAVVAGLGVSFS